MNLIGQIGYLGPFETAEQTELILQKLVAKFPPEAMDLNRGRGPLDRHICMVLTMDIPGPDALRKLLIETAFRWWKTEAEDAINELLRTDRSGDDGPY